MHMAQLMPLPLTVSCFSKIQVGFTFLVPAHPSSPRKMAVKRVCVCVCVCYRRVRVFCWRMCTHSYWGNFILLCIMVSSGVLAAEDPLRAQSPRNEVRLRHVIMPPP